uniref:C-type lectin n=1 Tax=Littorina littorea TaxID=31216 RepID=A0A0A7RPX3_LITLI|nr:C-type lectin [Littorina littorea]
MAHRFFVEWLLITAVFFSTAQAMEVTTEPPRPTTGPTVMSTTETYMGPTTSAGCVTIEGDQLAAGESKTYASDWSCVTYRCEKSGDLFYLIGHCFERPRCVDPERRPGDCCRSCPNGENCRVPSGKVIPAGQDVMDGGVSCRCPKLDWNNYDHNQDPTKAECGADITPTAGPTSTPPPPRTTTPLSPSPTQTPACEAGWIESKGACYTFFNRSRSFADAEAVCADSMSSKLATTKTRKERNFVRDLAGTTIWIGGDKRNRTDYMWSDGTAVSGGFSAWKSGEPDGKPDSMPDVNCMIMNSRGKWLDFTCTERKKPFVCKYILQ